MMGQGRHLHLHDLLVIILAAVVRQLHEPLFLACRALLGFLNVPLHIVHHDLVIAALTLVARCPAHPAMGAHLLDIIIQD